MDLYAESNYKTVLRAQIRDRSRHRLTLKRIAQKIGIQYTYLSRALNQEKAHLGEDHLFSLCRLLGLYPEEMEYMLLLRALAVASSPARREYLQEKLNRMRQARKLNASVTDVDTRKLTQEMGYLFDPLCQIVLISLTVPEFLETPRRLCAPLGIRPAQLQQILGTLSSLGFIELDGAKIARVLKSRFHYGTDHPLMRVHQTLLRNLSGTRLAQTAEEDKQCFMATFSADEATLRAVRERFQVFLKEVEGLVGRTKPAVTAQLNFELFRWT